MPVVLDHVEPHYPSAPEGGRGAGLLSAFCQPKIRVHLYFKFQLYLGLLKAPTRTLFTGMAERGLSMNAKDNKGCRGGARREATPGVYQGTLGDWPQARRAGVLRDSAYE